ncbi:gastrin/cholecystokinin type B receptor [Heteronotia binoei]|uniref:gastrin/cholecystokinin type B receptor n=1 Tax=Heteronotia binoei TaxID=13085 RepID=UPI0029312E8D|nr:gastrin/cholecystokinin type B receptor [Heteronotia binoei]
MTKNACLTAAAGAPVSTAATATAGVPGAPEQTRRASPGRPLLGDRRRAEGQDGAGEGRRQQQHKPPPPEARAPPTPPPSSASRGGAEGRAVEALRQPAGGVREPSARPPGRRVSVGGLSEGRAGSLCLADWQQRQQQRSSRAAGGVEVPTSQPSEAAGLREAGRGPRREGRKEGRSEGGMAAPPLLALNASPACSSPANGSAEPPWNGTAAAPPCPDCRRQSPAAPLPSCLLGIPVEAWPSTAPPRRPRLQGEGQQLLSSLSPPPDLELTVRVLLYLVIFLLSVVGNVLVISVLAVNKRLRTVTNSFLLSLAVSDLMVALFCIPFTFIPNLMQTFVFGKVVCKTVAYLMGMSVSVSTFSLVAISIERYNAICNPLQSRVWQTRSHAYRVIVATWLLSALLMLPYPVYTTTTPSPDQPGIYQCQHKWPGVHGRQAWYVLILVTLFFVPGLVMTVAYGLISWELYRGLRFEMDLSQEAKAPQNGGSQALAPREESDGCYIQVPRGSAGGTVELSVLTSEDHAKEERVRANRSEGQLRAKKRVIRMLLVIVVLFFVCWLPLYVANTWQAFSPRAARRALSGTPISFIHLLSYLSTCVNPFIYCFMNKRFRKALAATCTACCCCCRVAPCRPQPRPLDDEVTATGASLSKFSYTTVSSIGPP